MTKDNQNLRNFLNEIAKENGYVNGNVDIQAISSEGANYTSDLFLATISAPGKDDLNLFAKVANVSESVRAANNAYNIIYEGEHSFYSKLAVTFEKLYNKNHVAVEDRLYIPKFYGYKSSELGETLIIENLSAKGFGSFDRMETFDWYYASTSVKELAKFHALGLALKEENLEEFERMCKTSVDFFANEDMKKVFMEQAVKMGTQVIKEEYRERMRKYFASNDILDGLKIMWSPSDTGSLIHGDYRPNNLMHRTHDGKVEVVPIDYQTYHLGTVVADLMSFIWMGSDAQFRNLHYGQLLEHYYTQLTHALQNLRVDINKVYPRMVFEQELNEAKTVGLFIGLAFMSNLLVDPKDTPKIDSANCDNLTVEPNQLAKDRMNGIVEDYARWGFI